MENINENNEVNLLEEEEKRDAEQYERLFGKRRSLDKENGK